MTESAPNIPSQPPASAGSGCLAYGLLAVAGLYVAAVTIGLHVVAWYTDQVLLILGRPMPAWAWLPISWVHGLLLALPVGLLAVFVRTPPLRQIYQTWALATAGLLVFSFARLFPATWTQPAALAQIFLCLALAAVLVGRLIVQRRLRFDAGALILALAIVPIVTFPNFFWGALGSPLDSVLNLLAGLGLGAAAGLLLDLCLLQPLAAQPTSPARDIALGGLAASVTLLILGSGFGFGGSQLLLMIVLPPLGFAVAGAGRLAGEGAGWLPAAALVGLCAAAPLMFVDPDEMTLLLGGGEIMDWALRAAWLSLFLAWAAGLVLSVLAAQRRPPAALVLSVLAAQRRSPDAGRAASTNGAWLALGLGGLLVAWTAGLLVYLLAGQPGFHGERLFVILKDQADLSAAVSIEDRTERLSYVYTTLAQHADATQAGLRAALDLIRADYQPYYLVNAIEVSGGAVLRAYLALHPDVDRVLDSPRLRPLPEPVPISRGDLAEGPAEPQWNVTSIGADRVWEELGVTGEGIVVGQSDSGVQGDHPALASSYRGRAGADDYNWLDPWNHSLSPTDIGGHGTHTLGSIVGQGGLGVAPGAEWFGCVNLARNLANPALYLDCMQFMLAPYPQGGDPFTDGDPSRAAHVLNNSWGCPPLEGCDAESLEPAVSALRAAGIFVVASAGNEGPSCSSVSDPIAIYDAAFSVGAVDESGDVASFSSRGPVTADGSARVKPDILAPGVDVLSSLPGSTYGLTSGTSMAGPHVAGVVALVWSANPGLIGDIDRTEQILIESARPYHGALDECAGTEIPSNLAGYGLLDAYAAVSQAIAER